MLQIDIARGGEFALEHPFEIRMKWGLMERETHTHARLCEMATDRVRQQQQKARPTKKKDNQHTTKLTQYVICPFERADY